MLILSSKELTSQSSVDILFQHAEVEADRSFEAYYG
jgi:hypothetical protein